VHAKGERSPIMNASSDLQSDNDSNTSSSGVAVKRISKNVAQKTTKPLRSKKIHLDVESNPTLSKWFDRVAPEKRLRNIV